MYRSAEARTWRGRLICSAVALTLVLAGLAAWGEPAVSPEEAQARDLAARQVASCLRTASRPGQVRFVGTGVLWLTGPACRWSGSVLDDVKRWVGRGHVCWVNVSLATCFGVRSAEGGGMGEAVVPPAARELPLATHVKSVRCLDTFTYMRGLPQGAVPVLVMPNRDDHVVVAMWEVGKGLIIFRPEGRPDEVTWEQTGERRWIEPDAADGAQLLHNLNLVSLGVLKNNAFPLPQ